MFENSTDNIHLTKDESCYKHALEYLSTTKMRKTLIVAENETMKKIFYMADLVSKTYSTVIPTVNPALVRMS